MAEPADDSSDVALDAALDAFLDDATPATRRALDARPALPAGDAARLEPGATLGDYRITRLIGEGGMGRVFEATQTSIGGRRVALKVLRRALVDERALKRFRREVATIAALDHPGIVPVLGAGTEDGAPYYAMRLVDGRSAAHVVRELRRRPRSPSEAVAVRAALAEGAGGRVGTDSSTSIWKTDFVRWVARLGLEIAEALAHAHERGVVHRDVKPGNVLVTQDGHGVLVDFGLAWDADDEALTTTGEFLGTTAYAPPEQLRGERVDASADVYALGATLHELLSLRKPYEARSVTDLLQQIDRGVRPRLDRRLPADLRTICACALDPSPGRRYATATALADDLRAFLDGRPIRARAPNVLVHVTGWARRHPVVVVGALVLIGALAGLRVRDHLRARKRTLAGERLLAQCTTELAALRDRITRWPELRAGNDYDAIDAMRDAITTERAALEAMVRTAERELIGAFAHVAGSRAARDALADLHALELTAAFASSQDVIAPKTITAIDDRIATYDTAGRYAALLQPFGRARIDSTPSGARIEVRDAGGTIVHVGTTPFQRDALPAGSYTASIAHDGRADARLPFLVRRHAAGDMSSGGPTPANHVHLPLAEVVPADHVYIPAGWTLVEDDPPLWRFVDGFQMRRFETTYAEYLEWMNTAGDTMGLARDRPGAKPRFGDTPDELHVRRVDGRWVLARGGRDDWPVRGLDCTDAATYAVSYRRVHGTTIDGWYATLPSISEWVRAARGADARHFPWGDDFGWDRCGGYRSRAALDYEPEPYPVGAFEGDLSPFGIRDLAGSVREPLVDPVGPLRGRFAFGGGSYRSTSPDELRTTRVTGLSNEPRPDTGVRPVLKRIPDWIHTPTLRALPFIDDFERGNDVEVGGGWIEVAGSPLQPRMNATFEEQCSIHAGQLVCEGGSGNFSEPSSVWTAIDLPAAYEIRATLAGTRRSDANSAFGFELVPDFRDPGDRVDVSIDFEGLVLVRTPGVRAEGRIGASEGVQLEVELTCRDAAAALRVWPTGTERPAEALEVPYAAHGRCFLGLVSEHVAGVVLTVDRIAVRALD